MRSTSWFTRAVCLFVLASFMPAGVQFWNFLPSNEAHAAEPAKGPSSVAAWDELLTRFKMAAIVQGGDSGAPLDGGQRERLAKHFGRMSDPINRALGGTGDDGADARTGTRPNGRLTAAELTTLQTSKPYSGPRTPQAGIPCASSAEGRFVLAKVSVLHGRRGAAVPAPDGTVSDTDSAGSVSPEAAAASGEGAAPVPPALVEVADARAMLAAGDYASGAAALVTRVDWDENAGTRAEADLSLRLLWREAEAGSLNEEQLDAIEAALPAWDTLGTAESANQVMRFSQLRAKRHAAAGNGDDAARYLQTGQRQAAEILEVFPQAPALVETADAYLEMSRKLGQRETRAAVEWCWETSRKKETPRALAFAVRSAAAPVAHREYSDRLSALVMRGDATFDGETAEFAQWMGDAGQFPRVKAELRYALAMANYERGRWGRAVKELDAALAVAPKGDEIVYRSALARQFILNRISPDDFKACIQGLQEYLDTYPESPHIDRALMYMADVYDRAENHMAAYETYGRVIELFPSGATRETAERAREFLDKHILNSQGGMEVPDGLPVLDAPKLAMTCGPDALNRMLALQGVAATSSDLALLAGMTPDGTALSGLLESARNRGLKLAGVSADDPAELSTPFVAHTNKNHFFLVTQASDQEVTVRGTDGVQTIPMADFRAMFTGLALVRTEGAAGLDAAEPDRLKLAKGGDLPDYTPASCPNGDGYRCEIKARSAHSGPQDGSSPPSRCYASGDPDGTGQGTMGGPGMRLGGGGSAGPHVPGAAVPGRGVFGSGVTAPEMGFYIMGRQGSQHATQSDLSVPVRGGQMNLEFTRTYFNPWGTPKNLNDTLYTGFVRGLGIGWSHNYSEVLIAFTNTLESGAPAGYVTDGQNTTRCYVSSGTNAQGAAVYAIDGAMDPQDAWSGGAQTDELGNQIVVDPTTGHQTVVYADGSSKTFTAIGGQLMAMADANGNTISLNFEYGILDTISGPDDRFLQVYWDDYGRISAVELRKWTGGQSVALRAVEYTYTDNSNHASLSRVTYPDSSYNEFSYGKRIPQDDFYSYIADFRDRSGLHTTFTATYSPDYNDPNWHRVTRQWVTHGATGLSSDYDQTNAWGGFVVVSQYSGTPSTDTLVSKAFFEGDSSAFANSQEQYYEVKSGTTKRMWYYLYSHDNYRDLNYILDPANELTYRYEYNAQGQVTKMYRTPASPPLQFQYDSTGLKPVKRIDPNLAESTYTYDTAGNLTYYHHPSMGTASVHYVYDAYGQVTGMTDPRGRSWAYGYDSRGNQTSATDPLSHTTTMTYDDLGRVVSVLDPAGKLTEFEYTDEICGGCGGGQSQLALIRDHDDNETTFEYDGAGMLVRAENAVGQAVVNSYDTMHRLTQVAHENGPAVAAYTYDALNRVVAAADGDGNVTGYSYNFVGDLTAVTDGAGTTQLVYYNNGNLRQLIDGKSNTTNFYYYNKGGLAKMVNALGQTVKYTYDDMGNLTQVGAGTNGDIDTVTYAYPSSGASSTGLLQSVTYVNSGTSKTVSYAYDAAMQVTGVTDWLGTSGSTHSFEYDDAGQLAKYTDFDGAYQQYTYDDAGNLATLRDYEGGTTAYGYDNLHRLVSLASPGGKNWGFGYDPVGRLLTQTMPNGISSQYAYDAQGRPSSLQHKDGSNVVEGWNYSYDNNSNLRNVAAARPADSSAWTYLYDGRNRLRQAFHKNSAGALVSRHGFEYDAGDNLSSKTVTPYTQQFSDSFADGNITASPAWLSVGAWSAASLEAVNTANGSLSPEISQNIANSDAEYWLSYKIDDVNVSGARVRMLLRRTNATSDCVRVLFNANSLSIKQQVGGVTTDLLTDSSVVTASNTWYDVYARAAGGTIEVWRGPRGQKLSLVGRVTNTTRLSGEAVAFDTSLNTVAHFDDIRMSTARAANQSFTSTFTGTFDGWVQEVGTFSAASNYLTNSSSLVQGKMRRDTANGDFQMKFSYRDTSSIPGPEMQLRFRQPDGSNFAVVRLWPTSFNVSEVRAGATVLLGSGAWTTPPNTWYDVTLIADGAHIEVWRGPKGGAQTRVCSLDSATILSGNKSTIVVATNGTYSFDDFQMTAEDLSNTTYTYDAANQLTAMNVNGTTTNFTYDDWGRMAGKTQGSYAATYGYRFGDKLKAATSNFPGETASVAYNYDGLGKRRLEQLDNTTATWFRWSGWEETGEYAGVPNTWTVGAKQTGYVPGLAAYAGADPATADWRFNLNDHLGSPRQMLGQNKAAKARFDFSPYGELMRSAGLPLTVGYTGHRWDPAIGQYFAPFRYYNPQTARWNMRDPLGLAAGLNVYGYVGGNPITGVDPLGLIKECEENNTKTNIQNNGLPERRIPGNGDDRFPKFPDPNEKDVLNQMDELLERGHTPDPKDPTRNIWPWGNGRIVMEEHKNHTGGRHEGPHWHYRWNPPGQQQVQRNFDPGQRLPTPYCGP